MLTSYGYVRIYAPNHPHMAKDDCVFEHVAVVVAARHGRPLPPKAEVHHFNGNRADNANRNLVVCEDRNYHRLLEKRQRARAACGHVDWRKCVFCQRWDAPENLYVSPNGKAACHRSCHAAYEARRKRERMH